MTRMSDGRNARVTTPSTVPAAAPVSIAMPSTAWSGQLASGAVAPRKTTAIAGGQATALAVTHRHGWLAAPRRDQALSLIHI